MDTRFCQLSQLTVTSGFCLSCSYFILRFILDKDNPFCVYGPHSKDFPFPVFTKDSDF